MDFVKYSPSNCFFKFMSSVWVVIYEQDYQQKEKKKEQMYTKAPELLGDISKFAIQSDDAAWEVALKGGPSAVVSVKRWVAGTCEAPCAKV